MAPGLSAWVIFSAWAWELIVTLMRIPALVTTTLSTDTWSTLAIMALEASRLVELSVVAFTEVLSMIVTW